MKIPNADYTRRNKSKTNSTVENDLVRCSCPLAKIAFGCHDDAPAGINPSLHRNPFSQDDVAANFHRTQSDPGADACSAADSDLFR